MGANNSWVKVRRGAKVAGSRLFNSIGANEGAKAFIDDCTLLSCVRDCGEYEEGKVICWGNMEKDRYACRSAGAVYGLSGTGRAAALPGDPAGTMGAALGRELAGGVTSCPAGAAWLA